MTNRSARRSKASSSASRASNTSPAFLPLPECTSRIEGLFGSHFGEVAGIDDTDGLRITFANGDVVHLRPSGNAPELRCYNEAGSRQQVDAMQKTCMAILEGWKES